MPDKPIATDQVFNELERRVLAAIAAATIGEDESLNLPSASDPEILATILDKAEHFAPRLKSIIDQLQADANLLELSPAQWLDKLSTDPMLRSFARIVTMVTLQSYYQHPRVLAALNLPARPPFPKGHSVEAGDWSLLAPVKQKTPFFRDV